jgi:predicted CoA-binding protein
MAEDLRAAIDGGLACPLPPRGPPKPAQVAQTVVDPNAPPGKRMLAQTNWAVLGELLCTTACMHGSAHQCCSTAEPESAQTDALRSPLMSGDVLNPNKAASAVAKRLQHEGKTVHLVNPNDQTGTLHKSLKSINGPVDVIDLIINSYQGLELMKEAADLGIKQVFIQPGACSSEILQLCAERGIEVHQGCVLVEL